MAEGTTPTITYTDVINHLKNGVTRKAGDKGYDPERGSIEEKYNLTKADVTCLFKHPALIGKKVIIPKKEAFIFVDDRPQEEIEAPEQKYGAPTKTAKARLDKEAVENPVVEEETIPHVVSKADVTANPGEDLTVGEEIEIPAEAMEAADDAAILAEVDDLAAEAARADMSAEVASDEVEDDIF